MSQDKKLGLSEAAMDILNSNRKDKDAKQDSFGLGQKLNDTVNKTTAHDAGNPDWDKDRKSTRLNSSHIPLSRMPSSA